MYQLYGGFKVSFGLNNYITIKIKYWTIKNL